MLLYNDLMKLTELLSVEAVPLGMIRETSHLGRRYKLIETVLFGTGVPSSIIFHSSNKSSSTFPECVTFGNDSETRTTLDIK